MPELARPKPTNMWDETWQNLCASWQNQTREAGKTKPTQIMHKCIRQSRDKELIRQPGLKACKDAIGQMGFEARVRLRRPG